MREEFEAWAAGNVCLDTSKMSDGGYYRNIQTMIAWDAWQASRAALYVELPSKQTVICGTDLLDQELVEQALDTAGVSYT